jgi:hypothetical protein
MLYCVVLLLDLLSARVEHKNIDFAAVRREAELFQTGSYLT